MGKSEAKATTEMKTEVKATTAAKTENEAFAEARSEMKSLIASKAESDAENFSEFETQTRLTNKWIMIKGRGNLCIKFTGGRKRIRQGRCNSSRNVQWKFIRYGGRYIIMNRSGYVVDLYAYKRNNGAHIYAWNRKNGTNQRWSLSNIGRGRYLIRSQHSRRCLDNTGTARVNRHYHQWSCNKRNANQHFYIKHLKAKKRLRRKTNIRNAIISRGWKMIKGRGNYCIGYVRRHGYVRNRRCDNTNKVMWQFIKYAGRYIIRNKSGYVLRIYSSYVKAWTRQNNTPQRWLMDSIGGGRYLIKNQNSHKCIQNNSYNSYKYHYNQYNR